MKQERSEELREKLEFHKKWLYSRLGQNQKENHDRSFNYEKHYQSDNRSTSEPPVNRKNHSFIDESESNIMQELRNSNYDSDREVLTSHMKKDSVSYSYKDFFEGKQKPKRWEALYNLNKKNLQIKEENAQKAKVEEQDPECTFHPNIGRNLNNTLNKTLTNPLSLHERNKAWKEQKEARLTVHREMNKDRDLKGCTFQPDIDQNRKNRSFRGVTAYESKGIERHLRRQIVARQVKKEKEMILKNPLHRFTESIPKKEGKLTVPKPPNFVENSKDLFHIPCLKKPLIPVTLTKGYSTRGGSQNYDSFPLQERQHNNINNGGMNYTSLEKQEVGFADALASLHLKLHQFEIEYEHDEME